ncbi:MAG: hypothetical protein WCC12_15030 [Anaerolineales bacterium]
MSFPDDFAPMIKPLQALQRLLDQYGERGVIIGGIATGFLGKPRFTVDLDAIFLASIRDIPKILDLAEKEGIEARTQDVTEFAKRNRVLLLRHNESGINIDISLGILPF